MKETPHQSWTIGILPFLMAAIRLLQIRQRFAWKWEITFLHNNWPPWTHRRSHMSHWWAITSGSHSVICREKEGWTRRSVLVWRKGRWQWSAAPKNEKTDTWQWCHTLSIHSLMDLSSDNIFLFQFFLFYFNYLRLY